MKKVMVFGTFDGIHEGHRAFLEQARKRGNYLIVVIAPDVAVRTLKSRNPRRGEQERKNDVENLRLADMVVMGDGAMSSYGVVQKHRPDIIALGYDQENLRKDIEARKKVFGYDVALQVMNPYEPERYHSSIRNADSMKVFYTWQQFDEDKWKIVEWMKDKNFENIYGVPRGGLVVAVALSYATGIPVIVDTKQITRRTLVVDDIVDTAATIERLFQYIGMHVSVASIFMHWDAKIKPDFYIHEKKTWIIFPWETEMGSRYDGTARVS